MEVLLLAIFVEQKGTLRILEYFCSFFSLFVSQIFMEFPLFKQDWHWQKKISILEENI